MVTEQDRTLEGLKTAVQMEVDGQAYYLKLSQQVGDELGKKLLVSLAEEEDVHRQKFQEIYDSLSTRKVWPEIDFQPDWGRRLRTVFARAIEEAGDDVKSQGTELDALQTAIDMEIKSFEFYEARMGKATYGAERDFYEMVAGEEREHQLILLDYYEYLKDPASWSVKKEHPSLDGG